MKIVTILGGYGIFGGRIAEDLSHYPDCQVRIVGRDAKVGSNFAQRLVVDFRQCDLNSVDSLRNALEGSHIVIHAAGPFQGTDYRVAQLSLELGAHYLDVSDGRDFVAGIGVLDQAARERGLLVVSGVSSTPGITSTLIRELAPEFSRIEEIHTALSPGNQNPRGASTVGAVLTYLGKRIRVWERGQWVQRPGWGDARRLQFPPPVGRRRVHNCDVPDLELYPTEFGASTVRFQAGLELNTLNYLLTCCRWPCALFGWDLSSRARLFLKLSLMLFPFGTTNGALSVWLKGRDHQKQPIERRIAIVTDYDGPATPSSPAIILTKKLLRSGAARTGAYPCIGFLTLEELQTHLRPLGIWIARGDETGWHDRASQPGCS